VFETDDRSGAALRDQPQGDYGCLICNPPYGERSGDFADAEALAQQSSEVFRRFDTWSLYVLTALANFERLCQRQADRRRKLYNGQIACTYFQFHGPRPPASSKDLPASTREHETKIVVPSTDDADEQA
jgi:putative N6-adenine-specific DNA methylase